MSISEQQLQEAIRKDPRRCPGGWGCKCCHSHCDCGCRDECPKFRSLIRRELEGKDGE